MSLRYSILAVIVLSSISWCQSKPCTLDDAKRADMEAVELRSWGALYKSFRTYGQCDDGAIAEGYSESAVRILVDHWTSLPRFSRLAAKDESFHRFVLKHIDDTVDARDLRKIAENARTKCPKGSESICGEIRRRAESD